MLQLHQPLLLASDDSKLFLAQYHIFKSFKLAFVSLQKNSRAHRSLEKYQLPLH
jgi:hypothetical protein